METKGNSTQEIIFEIQESVEGGYTARALVYSIFTEGEDWEDLKAMVKDAVKSHFDRCGNGLGLNERRST